MNTWEEQQLVCLGAPEKAVERPALPLMNSVKLGGSETVPQSPPQEGRDGLSFQPPLLCPSVPVMPPPPTLVTPMTFFRSSRLLQRRGTLAPQQIAGTWHLLLSNLEGSDHKEGQSWKRNGLASSRLPIHKLKLIICCVPGHYALIIPVPSLPEPMACEGDRPLTDNRTQCDKWHHPLDKVLRLQWKLSAWSREKVGRVDVWSGPWRDLKGFARWVRWGRTFVADVVGYLLNGISLSSPLPSLTQSRLYSDFSFRQKPSKPI